MYLNKGNILEQAWGQGIEARLTDNIWEISSELSYDPAGKYHGTYLHECSRECRKFFQVIKEIEDCSIFFKDVNANAMCWLQKMAETCHEEDFHCV